ncbi:hypothetical protein JCM8547_003833 [Rhodosporidiobolus lusitaniae]
MDAFRTLTGGSRFDKQRFKNDIVHFQGNKQDPVASTSTSLPSELDFFAPPSEAAVESEAVSKKEAKKQRKRKRAAEEAVASPSVPTAPAEPVDYASLLRKHRIKLTGLDLPDPVSSLEDAVYRAVKSGGDKVSLELLTENWRKCGLREPTAVQLASWGTMLANRDILACAPTGSGKTFSFVFPLLALLSPSSRPSPSPSSASETALHPRVVIIEPTRELAMQVLRETRRLAGEGGWVVKVLGEEGVGGVKRTKEKKGKKSKKAKKGKGKKVEEAGEEKKGEPEAEDDEEEKAEPVEEDLPEEERKPEGEAAGETEEAYSGPIDILITTPLRLVFALKSHSISLSSAAHLILDEADKLFELNFLEQTDEILAACSGAAEAEGEGKKGVRKGMFSATMPSSVEELAKGVMAGAGGGMVRAIVGHKEAATTTITQSLTFVNTEDHKLLSLRHLIQSGQFTPPVLIFVQSITRAKELVNELTFDGINADAIHADRTAGERDEVVRRFAEGKVWCLICTDVMARGVDFKGVKLVVNYDFPQSAMSYIHRIGRTGRAGKEGRAVTFFTKADAGHLKTIVNVMRQSGCSVPEWMLALPAPSQDAKKALKMKPIGRKDISRTNGSSADAVERKGGKGKGGRKRVMGGKGGVFKKREGGKEEGKEEGKKEGGKKEGGTEEPKKKKQKREIALDE